MYNNMILAKTCDLNRHKFYVTLIFENRGHFKVMLLYMFEHIF